MIGELAHFASDLIDSLEEAGVLEEEVIAVVFAVAHRDEDSYVRLTCRARGTDADREHLILDVLKAELLQQEDPS